LGMGVDSLLRNWVIDRQHGTGGVEGNLLLRTEATTPNKDHLKGQWHEIFDLRFFLSNEHTWAPDSYPKIFLNSVTNLSSYSNSKFD
jgi:hypothetical protein